MLIVDTDDLIDPTDEGGQIDVHAGDMLTPATEAPRHESGQLEDSLRIRTDQTTAAVSLAGILSWLTTSAK